MQLLESIGLWKGPRPLGAVLACALAIAGCGGGGEGPISKAEFVKRASVICEQTSKRIRTEFTAYGTGREGKEDERAERAGELSFEEAAVHVADRILIPAMRQQLGELRALGIPDEDRRQAQTLLDAFDEGVEKAEAHPERAAHDGTEAFGRSERLAEAYGLEGC